MSLLLNCDLGESSLSQSIKLNERVMPFIDQANVACGYHAGDPIVMRSTLIAAKSYDVSVGAHPSYPDPDGFGRRPMKLPTDELMAVLHYQIGALLGIAKGIGTVVKYVKPHGALYNDMMEKDEARKGVMRAVAEMRQPLALMLQATSKADKHLEEANNFGIEVIFEAFADRCYDARGALVPRTKEGALHGREKMLHQVEKIIRFGSVTTESGLELPLHADSLCVHGDNDIGVEALQEIRLLIDREHDESGQL